MDEIENKVQERQRPFFLSILCFSVFVYSVVFVLIFSASVIFNNWIFYVLNDFVPDNGVEKSFILWLSLAGVILYVGSFLGALYIWKLKRAGFFIFLSSSLLIALVPFYFGYGSIINVIVFSMLIIFFAFYFRVLK